MSSVFLDPFINRLTAALDRLGEVGEDAVWKFWLNAYDRIRRRHVGVVVRQIMARHNLKPEQLALELGAAGAPFAYAAMEGKISLDKFQLMMDIFAPGECLLPPRSERFAAATMKTMDFVRQRLQDPIERPLDREIYEYVSRATRCKQWFVAREVGDAATLRNLCLRMCDEVGEVVEKRAIRNLTDLDRIIDEWSVAYLVCVSNVSVLEGGR